jgi:hypothetical protein
VFLFSALMKGLDKMEEARNQAVDDLIMQTRGGPQAGPADWQSVCDALKKRSEQKES